MRTIEMEFGDSSNYFVREAFNTLRTNILFSGKGVKVIVVTSCMAHEGKTTVSFEMSKSLAEANKKVLVIDADLRKSVTVSRYTKERGVCGLSQILSGQVSLEQAIYRTQIPGLDIVFAGPYPPNPAELVGCPVFKEMLDCVRDAYDYIIIDSVPALVIADAMITSRVADLSIYVVREGLLDRQQLPDINALHAENKLNNMCIVLNAASESRQSYGYSYRYQYASGSDKNNHGWRKIFKALGILK